MFSHYITAALLGFASTAVANGAVEDALVEVGLSASAHADEEGLAKRQDLTCATSVIMEIMPSLPTETAFSSWLVSEGGNRLDGQSCSVTVPSSFSDEYLDYFSTLTEWISTVEEVAAKATDCDLDDFYLTLSPLCTTSQTIFWSDDAAATPGSMSSTALPVVDIPQETILIGAAPSDGPFRGLAVAFTVFLGAVVLL